MATTSQNTNTQHTIITQPLTMSANSTSLPESRKRSADAQGTPPSAKKPCVTDMQKINATKEYSIESLSKLSTGDLEYIQKKIKAALHEQKKWVKVVECDRDTAIQHDGGAFLGEYANHYFYFAPCNAEAFTAKQLECLKESIACCFLCGQCCDEDDEDDEDDKKVEQLEGQQEGQPEVENKELSEKKMELSRKVKKLQDVTNSIETMKLNIERTDNKTMKGKLQKKLAKAEKKKTTLEGKIQGLEKAVANLNSTCL